MKENLCSISASVDLASSMEKFWPMHALGPMEKASRPCGTFAAAEIPFSNLSGLNSSASSPHTAFSRCMIGMGITIAMPLGSFVDPTVMSAKSGRVEPQGLEQHHCHLQASMDWNQMDYVHSESQIAETQHKNITASCLFQFAERIGEIASQTPSGPPPGVFLATPVSKYTDHVRRRAVFSWPAKKNSLHSCMISSMLRLRSTCFFSPSLVSLQDLLPTKPRATDAADWTPAAVPPMGLAPAGAGLAGARSCL
ncbi:LOW QUALITY PROTEIN: hypothetical protein U9M48_007508 [Paspalum notatum var. saurae]|uniref:Uncharacterized protein n=1 Tax=Paspalum notatum var. saurae TaxID=547442 RepID=A0AAQ3PRY8_PASNO